MWMALRDEKNRTSQNSLSDENDQIPSLDKEGAGAGPLPCPKRVYVRHINKTANSNRPSNRKDDDYEPSVLTTGRRQTQIKQ